jgi:hypothetical protein
MMAVPARLIIPLKFSQPAQMMRVGDIQSSGVGPHIAAFEEYKGARTYSQGFWKLVSGDQHDPHAARVGLDEMSYALGNLYQQRKNVEAYIGQSSHYISFVAPGDGRKLGSNFIKMPDLDGSKMTAGQLTAELFVFLRGNNIFGIDPASAAVIANRTATYNSAHISNSTPKTGATPFAQSFSHAHNGVQNISPTGGVRYTGPRGSHPWDLAGIEY